jgi:glutamate carboxypeptidase
LVKRFTEFGGQVTVIENMVAGNDVVGRFRGSGGPNVLMLCHTDTVYPVGTAEARPFRIEGSRALAPGVVDMKSGLLSAVYGVAALADVGFDRFGTITILCNSDEEAPPRHSLELIQDAAREADVAFCLEAGRANGDIVSARKGVVIYTLAARGRESHAGVAPEAGRNAVVALSERIVHIWHLNGMREGLTVNPGLIAGGTAANTVPGEARCVIDLRVARLQDVEAFEAEVQACLSASIVPDISFDLQKELAMPPMEKTEESQKLVDLARVSADELGFSVTDTATGGGSDGAYASAVCTPVLDGLGPVGGGAHSEREYIELHSIVPRTAMLARMVTLL